MGHVSTKEQVRILTFCHQVLGLLRMPPYELVLSDDPADEGVYASVNVCDQRYAATLWVAAGWDSFSDRDKVNTLIHEMLHLTHSDLQHDAMKPLEVSRAVSVELFDVVRKTLDVGLERWVDRMAEVLTVELGLRYPKKVKGKVDKSG